MGSLLTLREPKPGTLFRRLNGRLALFHPAADHQDYWRDYWSDGQREALLRQGKRGSLGEYEDLIQRHVPKDLPVLEAGCGPAHLVAALQARGYAVEGVDYEPEVVRFVKETLPSLNVREGNILGLDHPDESLGCYLSLGVVEHFLEGPDAALREARRVLHPRGAALISVPYLNPHRAAHLRSVEDAEGLPAGLSFHQYYFDEKAFGDRLRGAGLEVVEFYPYGVEAFLIREHPLLSRFWRSPVCRDRFRRALRRRWTTASPAQRRSYGHMLMAVCRPV